MGNNIVSLKAFKQVKEARDEDYEYKARILVMDKLELLEEMVRFQESRAAVSEMTADMMIRGKILFKALEDAAETQELRLLSRSYRRHLECELAEYIQKQRESQ